MRLIGRVSGEAAEKTLPSGTVISAFRVVTDRPPGHDSGQLVDTLECTARTARVRRSTRSWRKGDPVEVEGAVRRNFFATAAGKASRVDIEVRSARMIRRAPSA
ncbi:single-stranded DNA-binding protein [Nocardioides sp. B-3]|uniref:single-stranded DNA-binding protein n=1 Tax=Nocardioides sp. B-3 TaxID=2895565 RepID=UPI00215258C4|nr:single-stranded DNA-binding protein [Nocardioides sp. B-3]UUZ58993.1 single-stranded DNA-binding protein [Nocardioides sp. B-3]